MDTPGGRENGPGPNHQDPTKETQTTLLPDPGSPAGGKCSPHGPQLQSRSGWPGGGRGGGGEATGSQGLKGSGLCVCVSVHVYVYRCVWRLGYLGAVPRQNLPLAAGQCDLLLDGAFKFIWKYRKRGERGPGKL